MRTFDQNGHFYTKMGPNGSKIIFFRKFLFGFVHIYLVFHKMFILQLFGKLNCIKNQEIIKICVFLAKTVIFGTKKGVNESKKFFFQIFFFLFIGM